MTPKENIERFEKCVITADIAGMADCIGNLHAQWEELNDTTRAYILKLEAIFLSMLQARVNRSKSTSTAWPRLWCNPIVVRRPSSADSSDNGKDESGA
jgi:hypothetical protein